MSLSTALGEPAGGDVLEEDAPSRVKHRLSGRSPFEKMVEVYKAMLFYGEYEAIRPELLPAPLFMLDNVNFSSAVVEDPLPMHELLSLFGLEPGYASITGDCEVGPVLRELEHARAAAFAGQSGAGDLSILRQVIDRTVGISTAGATGAAHSILTAAFLRSRELEQADRGEVVYNTPCYCLPDGFCRSHALTPRPLEGKPEDRFLPSIERIIEAVGERTLACFLTFPANPALWSWGEEDIPALRRLIEHCQEQGVLLVADTVFQDLRWRQAVVPEIFALALRPTLLAKIHSPSKDRPLACGYRIGYAVVDAGLEPWISQAECLTKNSSATASQVWLAFDSLFRLALLRGSLESSHFELLEGKYLFGYGAPELTAREMFSRVMASGLFARYVERLASFKEAIWAQLQVIHDWLAASTCFEPGPLPDFGNLLMVRIRAPFDAGGEDAFFVDALIATHVASTTGGCFGITRESDVWIRVATGSAPTEEIVRALSRLEEFLKQRVRAMAS